MTATPSMSGRTRVVAVAMSRPQREFGPVGSEIKGRFAKQSAVTGRPAVRFDTATGFASSPSIPVDIRGDAALSIMLVMNLQPHQAQPPYDGVLGIGNPAHAGDPGKPLAALVQINRGEDHALHFAGGWNHDASLGARSFKAHFGKPVLLTVIKNPGPMRSTTRLFINGINAIRSNGEPLEGKDGVPDIQHRTDIGVYLGKALDWCGSIQGDLAEVIVYNSALQSRISASASKVIWRTGFHCGWTPTTTRPNRRCLRRKKKAFGPTSRSKIWYLLQSATKSWIRTPVDRFILHELDQRQLKPAAPAAKLTLLRRVTFDLTGLPPTPGR